MNYNRCLALLCAVFLATAAGCGARMHEKPETDAELACREGGFNRGSTAFADCVEERSGRN